jgi:hypothetical protein
MLRAAGQLTMNRPTCLWEYFKTCPLFFPLLTPMVNIGISAKFKKGLGAILVPQLKSFPAL